jgi:PhnB protein
MTAQGEPGRTQISVMLAVPDAPTATSWYQQALGARLLWSLGSVVGLEIEGAPFFLHEPTSRGFQAPAALGGTTTRVEVFVADPDAFIDRAVTQGATPSPDGIKDHEHAWGVHRQGGFTDPYGHVWSVGDHSPLRRYPELDGG